MSYFVSRSQTFSNRRDWHDYLTAVQSAVVPPVIADALKAGREWLSQAAYNAAPWNAKAKPLTDNLASDFAAATGLDGTNSFKSAY